MLLLTGPCWGSPLYKGCQGFDQALKLVNILLTLVTSLGSVMLPRVSSLLSPGDLQGCQQDAPDVFFDL